MHPRVGHAPSLWNVCAAVKESSEQATTAVGIILANMLTVESRLSMLRKIGQSLGGEMPCLLKVSWLPVWYAGRDWRITDGAMYVQYRQAHRVKIFRPIAAGVCSLVEVAYMYLTNSPRWFQSLVSCETGLTARLKQLKHDWLERMYLWMGVETCSFFGEKGTPLALSLDQPK